MKKLHELQLEEISGGSVSSFCGGFAAATGVYVLGAVANLWNPVGWGGGIAIAVIGIGCAVY